VSRQIAHRRDRGGGGGPDNRPAPGSARPARRRLGGVGRDAQYRAGRHRGTGYL